MNCPALGLRVSSVLFGFMGLAHLIRIIVRANLQLGDHIIHRRWSGVAVVVLAALSVWLWTLACKADCTKAETPPAGKPAA